MLSLRCLYFMVAVTEENGMHQKMTIKLHRQPFTKGRKTHASHMSSGFNSTFAHLSSPSLKPIRSGPSWFPSSTLSSLSLLPHQTPTSHLQVLPEDPQQKRPRFTLHLPPDSPSHLGLAPHISGSKGGCPRYAHSRWCTLGRKVS